VKVSHSFAVTWLMGNGWKWQNGSNGRNFSEIVLELKHFSKKFSITGAGTARMQHAGQQPSAANSGVKSKTEVVADGSALALAEETSACDRLEKR
jgi:hypothetical protein